MSEEKLPSLSMRRAHMVWDMFLNVCVKTEFSDRYSLENTLKFIEEGRQEPNYSKEPPHFIAFDNAFEAFVRAELAEVKGTNEIPF